MALTLCLCTWRPLSGVFLFFQLRIWLWFFTQKPGPTLPTPGSRLWLLPSAMLVPGFYCCISTRLHHVHSSLLLCSVRLPEANPCMLVFSTNAMITLDEYLFGFFWTCSPSTWPSELWGLRLHAPGSFIKLLFAFGAPPGIALRASCFLELLVWLLDSLRQP